MPPAALHALLWFLCPLALALAGTWLALRYATRKGLLDQPGERRSHAVATPRGGGISIVAALLPVLLVLAYTTPALRGVLLSGAMGMVLVAGVGWMDDHRPLSPALRLSVHALTAVLLSLAILLSGYGPVPALFAFVAVLVLVNVWNFMDGIDGLAASQAALAGAAYALLAAPTAGGWLALALAGASCGFLPYNFPRARIFLGDVGSGSLGLALSLVLIVMVIDPDLDADAELWALLVFPLAAFLVDASLTLGRRMIRREAWWQPHVQHAYQVWSRRLGRHLPVTLAYAGWSAVAVAVMSSLTNRGHAFMMVTIAAAGWCLAGGLVWLLLQSSSRKS